jgi:hypothetical protein
MCRKSRKQIVEELERLERRLGAITDLLTGILSGCEPVIREIQSLKADISVYKTSEFGMEPSYPLPGLARVEQVANDEQVSNH